MEKKIKKEYSGIICLNDVSALSFDLNPVLYNTNLPYEERKSQLKNLAQTYLHLSLNDDQLETLCSYDRNHLDMFVSDLKAIVYPKE